ncbi:UvrD-helicase domain-containing protein [Permianibacter fluminis]|uniref:UvrD-helicase domain-containing protein n=1 Tax=Permianibacter fluminis TaxID=2738515 RepID=UPI002E2D700B|nr:UvrD-helicase domain-containing protein [Permianibacter fluminis]
MSAPASSLNSLNPAQQQAVRHVHSPLLVLAGAGSGKTLAITHKLAHLVNSLRYAPESIYAVTFTNKAAREMKERAARLMGETAGQLNVSTFHTLGLTFIRHEHKALQLKSSFTLLDEDDSLAMLRDAANLNQVDKQVLGGLRMLISNWKNALLTPEQALTAAKDAEETLAAKAYAAYQRTQRACHALDFDDLILLPAVCLREEDHIRNKWQHKVRYLLVDEYQDTNGAQYELVKLLAGDRAAFTVVGDDDQSIYAWRGANPENLNQLKADYPKLEVIKLEQNYRSFGRILKCANTLIANNPHMFEKSLWSQKQFGEPLRVMNCANDEDESERVVNEIMMRKMRGNLKWRQFAILFRGNHQARLFEKAMIERKVPYKLSGGQSFFGKAEIKDVLAYLRLLVNDEDDAAFLRIVNVPRREIGASTIEKLGAYAQRRHRTLLPACRELGLETELSGRPLTALRQFSDLIGRYGEACRKGDAIVAINELLRAVGYEGWLYEQASSPKVAQGRWQNVQELLSWLERSLKDGAKISFDEAVNKLLLRDMLERSAEDEQNADEVQMLTLHAAKGLEYPHVYMVGMEEELLPHRTSIEENSIEEERRLCYVGITRAQETLTFTLCTTRKRFGETIRCEPSRFLAELPVDDLKWDNAKNATAEEKEQVRNEKLAALKALLDD